MTQVQDEAPPSSGDNLRSVPWTTRDVYIGLIIFTLSLVVVVFLSPAVDANLVMILVYLFILVLTWKLTVQKYELSWRALGFRGFRWIDLGLGFGLLVIIYGSVFTYTWIMVMLGWEPQTGLLEFIAEQDSPFVVTLTIAFLGPLVEEIFFRGFVFAGLRERFGWKAAGLISSLLFAASHLQLVMLPPFTVLGFFFAYFYQRTRSLLPALIFHAFINSIALLAAFVLLNSGLLEASIF